MPAIPEAVIEQIRSASDIVEVINGHIPLKRAGGGFVACCPFHKERTPSFHVTPSKQIYHCFGCHKGGDVFKFVQEYENIGFLDAVRRLADRAHITIEFDNNPDAAQSRHVKDQLLDLHEQLTQRWQTALRSEGAHLARTYLSKRGVTAQAIDIFRIGFAPEAWDDTLNWSRGKGFDIELVEQAGLVIRKEDSEHHYDRFRGRLMFPICDEQGRVIGFSGRVLTNDKGAKYVNSPETPIFTKGKTMFGLDKSKRALLDAKSAIICEGQLDLIACFMSGVKNVVAPQGTALTADHARILKRYVDEVVLCFDADNAGQTAAVRSFDSLLAAGLTIRVGEIPTPHDPDSFIKQHGPEKFQELITKAKGFFDYYLDRLFATNDATTDRGRLTIVRQMGEALNKTGSTMLTDTYAQRTAIRLGVSLDSIRAEFNRSKAPTPREEQAPKPIKSPFAPPPPEEWWLLRLLLETDDFVDWILEHLELEWLTHPMARGIVSSRLQAVTWSGVPAWLTTLDPEWQTLVTQVLADSRPAPKPEETLKGTKRSQGIVQKLRDNFIDQKLESIRERMQRRDITDEERIALMSQAQRLRKSKSSASMPA